MLHLRLIILSVLNDVSINNEMLLVIDFMNLKIKPTQLFECAHRGKVYICVFIESEYSYIYMSIYVYTVFLKKNAVKH
jgi:hypothetical protein